MAAMIGHNGGPSMERGAGFRKVAWKKARTNLLPALPLEVVRLRVKRAERLGLPYKTYATIRAVSGRDIVAFLFSSNALDVRGQAQLPDREAGRLASLSGVATRLAAVHAPLDPEHMLRDGHLDAAARAPSWTASWTSARHDLRDIARSAKVPLDGTVIVAATEIEREWYAMGGFAGLLSAHQMFGSDAAPLR